MPELFGTERRLGQVMRLLQKATDAEIYAFVLSWNLRTPKSIGRAVSEIKAAALKVHKHRPVIRHRAETLWARSRPARGSSLSQHAGPPATLDAAG